MTSAAICQEFKQGGNTRYLKGSMGAYRGLHGPGVGGSAQLPGFVRKEAHLAAAVACLSAHLGAVL